MTKPKLKKDWIDRRVVTLRELKNGFVTMPAGISLTVDYNRGGLGMSGGRCPACGVAPHIRGVPEDAVLLLPVDPNVPTTPTPLRTEAMRNAIGAALIAYESGDGGDISDALRDLLIVLGVSV